MRQFILAGNCAYGSNLASMSDGQLAFTYLNNGVETIIANGTEKFKYFNLLLARNSESGDVILPMSRKHLSYVKGTYNAATTFVGTVTLDEPTEFSDYTIILVKKGVRFNERNRWTATVHTGLNPDVDTLGAALANQINNNTVGHGLTAAYASNVITITAEKAGVDYEIVLADAAQEFTKAITTVGAAAYGDVEYIKDLANKAAADAGFKTTAVEGYAAFKDIIYPLDPLKATVSPAPTYTIYTIRFVEPREMGQARNDEVHQIVQIAIPTGAACISTIDTILAALVDYHK